MVLKPDKKSSSKSKLSLNNSYPDFSETLDELVGLHRFTLFARETFDNTARQQSRINLLSHLHSFSGAGILVLGGIAALKNVLLGGFLIVAATALLVAARNYKNAPTSDSYNKLLEDALHPDIAKIVLSWAQDLAASDMSLFQLLPEGAPKKLSSTIRNAGNMAMVLLGDERHRKALRSKTRMSDAPILYFKGDHERIFGSLELALNEYRTKLDNTSETQTTETSAPEPPAPTPLSKDRDNPKTFESPAFVAPALKPKSKPRKSRPQSDSAYLQTLQRDYALLGAFIKFTETDEYKAMVNKSPIVRDAWTEALKLIHEHWHEWTLYRTRKGDPQEFIKKLYGRVHLNYPPGSKKRTKFREGKYRDLGRFIKETGVIDTSRLVNQAQPDLFLDQTT